MNNFTGEFFNVYPNPFPQHDQAVPSPTDTPVAQENDCAPLPSHDGGMLAHVVQHQPEPQFDSIRNYRQFQAFTFAYNSKVQQQSAASTSGGSFLPFNGSVSGIGALNQHNGGAGGGMAFNHSLNPQTTAGYNRWIHYPQDAKASGFNQLPPTGPASSFVSYQVNPMAQHPTLGTQQKRACGYHQTMSVPGGAYQPEAIPIGQQSFASNSNDAADALPEQRQRVTTHLSVAEGESASPAINATGHTFHNASFPSYNPDAAAPQPMYNGCHAIAYPQQPEAPPPVYQSPGYMCKRLTASNHNDATNAPQDPRLITESPLTDEPSTPPDNAPCVMVPGDVKEHNRDLVSPVIQMPIPRHPQVMFSRIPMIESPVALSPVGLWVNEKAGPKNLQANSQQAAETSIPPVQTPLVFELHTGPQLAGAGSRKYEHEHEDEAYRPTKRARMSWSPRTAALRYNNAATNMGEQATASNHNDTTDALENESITESPLTGEPLTPPDHKAPLTGRVMVPGEVKKRNRDLVSPPIQMPVPRYPQVMFSPMVNLPAAPSPVGPWVSEQPGPVNLQGTLQQATEVLAPQPVQSAIPSLERRPAVVNSGTSTRTVEKPLVFELHMGTQSPGAGSSRKHELEHEDVSRPPKRARRSWSPRTVELRCNNAAIAATSSTLSAEAPAQNCTMLEFRASRSMDYQIFYTGPPEKPERKAPRKATATKLPKKASGKSTGK